MIINFENSVKAFELKAVEAISNSYVFRNAQYMYRKRFDWQIYNKGTKVFKREREKQAMDFIICIFY